MMANAIGKALGKGADFLERHWESMNYYIAGIVVMIIALAILSYVFWHKTWGV